MTVAINHYSADAEALKEAIALTRDPPHPSSLTR